LSLVRLDIKGISYSQTQTGAYALVLKEVEGERTLPIIIGAFEAQAIAIALEKEIKPPRPLTHDLFKTFANRFEIVVKQVIIHKLTDGVFFSSLICERDKIEEIIDARTSDAIALAVRFNAPIFTYKNILDKAGIFLKRKEEIDQRIEDEMEIEEVLTPLEKTIKTDDAFESNSIEELNILMGKAVADEDYELAAKIRDEIDNRK
jgi:bifunctional DNase/RNase